MSYSYKNHRDWVFTEKGQVQFLSIRDRANRLIDMAGAASLGQMISGEVGVNWDMIACVDRLAELGEIHEVKMTHPVRGQSRIFIKH